MKQLKSVSVATAVLIVSSLIFRHCWMGKGVASRPNPSMSSEVKRAHRGI